MNGQATIERMAKKRPGTGKQQPPQQEPEKVVIYLEVLPELKAGMERLAREHNRRLTGECITALQEYLARHTSPSGPSSPST